MPITTRAAIAFAPNQPLEIRELTLADPGPGQVRLKLVTTGLCHSDLHVIDGKNASFFPIVLGHEGLGEVEELGEGVTDLAVGDRVLTYLVADCGVCEFCLSGRTNLCAQMHSRWMPEASPFSLDGKRVGSFMGIGSFAERTVMHADQLVKISPEAPVDQTCCIACGVTTGLGAALISARVTPGTSVAVIGAGGVGLSALQGAKLAGASRIVSIDRNPARREVALSMGATDFIDASAEEDIVAAVRSRCGAGVDFSFECVGVPALARQALEMAHPAWGVSVSVGIMPTGAELSTLPINLMTGRRWTGSMMGGAKRADVARFVGMFLRGEYRLDDLVSHRLTLAEINHGFAMMQSGEGVRSVVVYD
jgi:S-(hydroxymethyl)glutathione dehydrogenase / alcohol dehydrogenase